MIRCAVRKNLFIVLLLAVIMQFGTANLAYAYETLGVTWQSSNIKYYYDNYNSVRGKTYFVAGAQAWNTTDVTFSKNSFYNVYISEVYFTNVDWDGLGNYRTSGNYFTTGAISINTAQTTTWNSNGALKSVVVHEFGHALGLADNGNTETIMNVYTWGTNSRYGTFGLTTPQTDDTTGVNDLY